MNIAILGTGYVALVSSGAIMSEIYDNSYCKRI
jgi:UDP-glucose 6-dehydrogenase